METSDEVAADSCDSERTISDGFVGIPNCGKQAQDDALEAYYAMVLPVVPEKKTRSDSERRLGISFVRIPGHAYTGRLKLILRLIYTSNPMG